jgi:asparaginyl-tRNA synthetase
MIEFDEIIDICEDSIRFTSQHILDKNMSDLEFFKKSREVDVIARLEKLADSNQYPRISYKDAVQLLSKNQVNLNFGDPLTTEHERYIANIFNG